MRVRQEAGRVLRYLLISAAVYAVAVLLGSAAASWLTACGLYTGKLPWTLRDSVACASAAVLALLHRRFTFRVNVPVGGALLALFVGAALWRYVTDEVLQALSGVLTPAGVNAVWAVLGAAWLAMAYLLQRMVFYRAALASGPEENI